MNIRKLRKQHGLTQAQFYNPLGVTQSGGSRYESGRTIPRPTQMLIALKYGPEKDRKRVQKRLGLEVE